MDKAYFAILIASVVLISGCIEQGGMRDIVPPSLELEPTAPPAPSEAEENKEPIDDSQDYFKYFNEVSDIISDFNVEIQKASGGDIFKISGSAPKFPDGTLLHMTLFIHRDTEIYEGLIDADDFSVLVEDQEFFAQKQYENQRFAPLRYWVDFELIFPEQRVAIRDFIITKVLKQELDPETARTPEAPGAPDIIYSAIKLARKTIIVGSDEEAKEFREKTTKELLVYLDRVRALLDRTLDSMQKPLAENLDWPSKREAIILDLRAYGDDLEGYLDDYVIWQDKVFIDSLKASKPDIGDAIKNYEKGNYDKAIKRLNKLKKILEVLKEQRDDTPDIGECGAGCSKDQCNVCNELKGDLQNQLEDIRNQQKEAINKVIKDAGCETESGPPQLGDNQAAGYIDGYPYFCSTEKSAEDLVKGLDGIKDDRSRFKSQIKEIEQKIAEKCLCKS